MPRPVEPLAPSARPSLPLQNRRLRPFIAYLNDPEAVGGVGPLLRQRDNLVAAANALGGHIGIWRVDSGRRYPGQRCGDAALRLVAEIGRGEVLLIESLAVLGADDEVVRAVAGAFAALGVAVVEASTSVRAGTVGPDRQIRRAHPGAGRLALVDAS